MKNRNLTLDICKALAMIFIILIHVMQRSVTGFTNNWSSSVLLVLGVPIYFLVSGIAINYRKPLSPLGFVYDVFKRALMYMWPAVLFLLLRVWFYKVQPNFSLAFKEYMEYPAMGLWVLWLLVWYNALVDIALLVSFILPKWKKLIVSITLVIGFTIFVILRQTNVIENYHFIGYDYFVIYTPIFFVGYLLGDKIFSFVNKWISLVIFALSLVGAIILCRFSSPFLGSGYHIEENLYIYYLGALCAVGVYYGFATLIERIKIGEPIALMGRFSLECYFLHLILLREWGRFDLGNGWLTFLATLGLTLLCIGNTVVVVAGTYFLPFTHFILFGRHYSYYSFENKMFDKLKEICTKDYFHKSSNNINNITE